MKIRFLFAATIALALAFTLTSCGPSATEIAIRSAPSIEAVTGLKDKLIWLQDNARSGGNYIIEIDTDEKDMLKKCGLLWCSVGELVYKDKSDITITLKGTGTNRIIRSGFTIGHGVTLILDDNITLKGGKSKVGSGGTLVMNDGSAITGAINNYNSPDNPKIFGAGVYVDDGGTFIMKGGIISGNTIHPRQLTVQEVQNAKVGYAIGRSLVEGSKKAVEKAEEKFSKITLHIGGAGVYVSGGVSEESGLFAKKPAPSGTFIKTGGVITGYSSDQENGNVIRSVDGEVVNGFGHAIAFGTPTYDSKGKEVIAIDTTIGPEITINFKNGIFSEGRNEETKEATIPSDVPVETQEEDQD